MPDDIQDLHSERVDAAIAEYLDGLKLGAEPDLDFFLDHHKDIAAELKEFLADYQALGAAAKQVAAASTNATESTGRYAAGRREQFSGPHRFGRYELLEEIARGGMGVVFKARQSTPGRVVALKMILAGQFATKGDVDRFFMEAHAAATLDHPNIVPIFEVGEEDGQHYYTMAFVDGQSLGQRLLNGPLTAAEAAKIIREVALAVEYAHQHGVVHRDLKPSNILQEADGRVRVTDFGLAKREAGERGVTRTGELLGTPSFMSPEQVSGDPAKIGRSADVYGLGATLYALVTGRPPIQAATIADTLKHVVEREPVPPHELDATIPQDLETIVLKCLEKSTERRYPNAHTLADELNRFLEGRPIQARPVGRAEHAWRWCRRNPVVAGLAVSVFAALTLGIVTSSYFAATASREAKSAVEALEEAESQRNIAEGVNSFYSEEVFGLANPEHFKRAGISLQEAIDIAASRVDERFPDDPQLRAVLFDRLGEVYAGMGENANAAEQYANAARLWESLFGPLDQRTLNSRSRLGRAVVLVDGTKPLESVLADQTRVLGPNHADTLMTARDLMYARMTTRDSNDLSFAKDVYERSLSALGPHHPTTLSIQNVLSWTYRWNGDRENALEHAKTAAAGLRAALGSEDVSSMHGSYNYAACLQAVGRYEEAVAQLKRLYSVRERVLGPVHSDTQWTLWRLSAGLRRLGRESEAIELCNRNAALVDDGHNTDFYMLAGAFATASDHESAVEWLQKTAELNPDDIRAASTVARAQLTAGDVQGYRDSCARMSSEFSATDDESQFWLTWTYGLGPQPLADLSGPTLRARELVARDPHDADRLATLGMLLYRAQAYDESARHLSSAIDIYPDGRVIGSVAHATFFLAMIEWQLGRKVTARRLYANALELEEETTTSMSDWNRRATLSLFRHEAEALLHVNSPAVE